MAKTNQIYNKGDFVFAKVEGHPYWPARIETKILISPSAAFKYEVIFYATSETSICAANKIKQYNDNNRKELLKKHKKRRMSDLYKKSVKQIEKAIKKELSSVSLVPNKPVRPKGNFLARNQERKRRAELILNQENEWPQTYCYRKLTKKVSTSANAPLGVGIRRNKIAAQTSPKTNHNTVLSSPDVTSQYLSQSNVPRIGEKLGTESNRNEIAAQTSPDANHNTVLSSPGVSRQSIVPITHVKTQVSIREQQKEFETTRVLLKEHVAATLDLLSMNDPNPDDAIKYLKYIEKALLEKVQRSTLLRSPEVIPSTIQLSKYIGNVDAWNFNDLQLEVFNRKATEIRDIAGKIAKRFKQLVPDYHYEPTGVPSRAVFQHQEL